MDAGSRIGRDWADRRQQVVPLPFPELEVAEGVFAPTQGSYLLWKTLFLGADGHNLHCLDVGSGCGVLAVQMALNGAASVDALDIQEAAVANTLENAALNGVRAAVSAEVADLNHWRPRRRYDLVVASLYQMPVDPEGEPQSERPPDFWGRELLDRFLRLLPQLLVDGGRALVLQLSIVGQERTAALLEELGLEGRIVDFGFFPFGPLFSRNAEQIAVVESLSDAHHIHVGNEHVMIAYALEIRRKAPDWAGTPPAEG
jgi:release factor glutamine methyltransferase